MIPLRFHAMHFIAVCTPGSLIIADDEPVSFHRDVVPIFRTNCIVCHKPGKARGGLNLTTHEALLEGGDGGMIIAAGDPEGSRLIETICGDEPEMPKDSEPLMTQEIEILRRWVAQGAQIDEPSATRTQRPTQPPTYQALPPVQAMALSPDGKILVWQGDMRFFCTRPMEQPS